MIIRTIPIKRILASIKNIIKIELKTPKTGKIGIFPIFNGILNPVFFGFLTRKYISEELTIIKTAKTVKFVRLAIDFKSPSNNTSNEATVTQIIDAHGASVLFETFLKRFGSAFSRAIPYTSREPVKSIIRQVLNVQKRAIADRMIKLLLPKTFSAIFASGAFSKASCSPGITLTALIPTRI